MRLGCFSISQCTPHGCALKHAHSIAHEKMRNNGPITLYGSAFICALMSIRYVWLAILIAFYLAERYLCPSLTRMHSVFYYEALIAVIAFNKMRHLHLYAASVWRACRRELQLSAFNLNIYQLQ